MGSRKIMKLTAKFSALAEKTGASRGWKRGAVHPKGMVSSRRPSRWA